MDKRGRILIIEDMPNWQDLLTRTLKRDGFQVEVASSFQEAVNRLENDFYHLAIIDKRLVDWDPENAEGMTVLDELKQRDLGDAMEKVMISAYGTIADMRKAFTRHDVADFISKDDFDRDQFRDTIRNIFRDRVQINFDLEIILEGGLTYEELLTGIELDETPLKKDSPQLPRAIEETIDLFQKLFHSAKSIVVTPTASQVGARSGSRVVKVQPYYADRHGEPVIVKLGGYRSIDVEYSNFEAYVKGFIGASRATNVLDLRRTALLGGIIYSLVGAGLERVQDFTAFYQKHSVDEVLSVLSDLFESTCANWYADRGLVQHCRLTQEYLSRLGFDYAKLETALKDNFPSFVSQKTISFRDVPDRQFTNPVYAIKDKDFSRSTYRSVTHGDVNGGNILVDPSGHTWLIDFASTGKGHILRDVIQLETVIKFQLLESRSLGARAAFEEALASVRLFRSAEQTVYSPPDDQFDKAFKAIIKLRQIAGNLVHPSDDFSEYNIGLLYMALNILRFYNVPKINRLHAILSAALICDKLGMQA